MANYSDIGLSAAQYATLTSGTIKRAFRFKVLKPQATKILSDYTDYDTVKIERSGLANAGYLHLTSRGEYLKAIVDDKNNRTFILHDSRLNSGNALVSIINHNLATDHADYCETINAVTSAGFPSTRSSDPYDIAYDPNAQLLAVGIAGAVALAPALLIFDMNKYIDTLEDNTCNQLKENPDYLACDIWTPGDTFWSWSAGSIVKKVAYYNHRFYVWVYSERASSTDIFWQLGSLDGDGAANYTMISIYGDTPWPGYITGIDANKFDESICWPVEQPRSNPCNLNTLAPLSGDLHFGEPVSWFGNINIFEIDADGILTMGMNPTSSYQNGFGVQGGLCAFDLTRDIPTYISSDDGDFLNDTEAIHYYKESISVSSAVPSGIPPLYRAAAATNTTTINLPRKYNPDTGQYEYLKNTFLKLTCEISVEGAGSALNRNSDAIWAQTQFGAYKLRGNYVYGGSSVWQWVWSGIVYVNDEPNNQIIIGCSFNAIAAAAPWTVNWEFSLLPYADDYWIAEYTEVNITTGTWTDANGHDWPLAQHVDPGGTDYEYYNSGTYLPMLLKFVGGTQDTAADALGLRVIDKSSGTPVIRNFVNATNPLLEYDHVTHILHVGSGALVGFCTDNDLDGDNDATAFSVQFFEAESENLDLLVFSESLAAVNTGAKSFGWNYESGLIMFMSGIAQGGTTNAGELWIWTPALNEYHDRRNIRYWWDGENPDMIISATESPAVDLMGQPVTIHEFSMNQNKGETSYAANWKVNGPEYLPWIESPFNESSDAPGEYQGTFDVATRIIVQRGVWKNHEWTWLDEGQLFIDDNPANKSAGITTMEIKSIGVIGFLVTKAIYKGYHEPDRSHYADVAMLTDDGLTYYYEDGGNPVIDWVVDPAPVIKSDGVAVSNYLLDAYNGEIIFNTDHTANTVTGTFDAFDAGTNEAEDIIICILSYPNALGGAGLDASWYSRIRTDETPTTTDDLTFTCTKNNVITDSLINAVYRDGAPVVGGYTWDFRAGTFTFGASQAGHVITCDYEHYTIQTSGITLPPINLPVREYPTAYDAIQKVMSYVSPNYILREGRDGKIEAEYFTQKAAGDEDIVIANNEIVIKNLTDDPIYEEVATRVISLGQARIAELENFCIGKTVTDLATGAGLVMVPPHAPNWQSITDGDPATQQTYGWGDDWGATSALIQAAGADGVPFCSIDMEENKEVNSILIARGNQAAQPVSANDTMGMSVWASQDNIDYYKIINAFIMAAGQNQEFRAGEGMWQEGTKFRYIKIHIHGIDLYSNPKTGQLDSQLSLSEVQARPHETIEGVAELQDTDPTAAHYDQWGLLTKYGGHITIVARGGSPDSSLQTQEAVDADASYTLDEVVRLLNTEQVDAFWIPAVGIYNTIKFVDTAWEIERTFFVESHTFGADGDTFTGTTLP